jgi:DNA-binding transcriptional LysR family regulator
MRLRMAGLRWSTMLDWDDLRCFLAVARAGTLSGAARGLGLTQPSVGRRIAAFEKALGARLFERTSAGHVLSPTGKKLLPFAERMETDALAAERTASGRDMGLRGPVRITASEWMVDRVLSPAIAPLLARHPQLEIELLADARHLSLVRREADIAVRPSRFEHQEVVEIEVATLAFGLFASDDYLEAQGMPDFARQCEGHALIAMSESLTRVPDVDFLPLVAARARVVARANGRLPMATLAAAGAGIACLPLVLGDRTPSLRRLRTPIPGPERKLWLALHRESRGIPRVKQTASYLRDALRRLQPALAGGG